MSVPPTAAKAPARVEDVRAILQQVPDPEIPILSVLELGIIRDIQFPDNNSDGALVIGVAPTYSGCPAVAVIEQSIVQALTLHGWREVRVERRLAPPWSTDWITASGLAKLKAYGIAPPQPGSSKRGLWGEPPTVACPRCDSCDTTRLGDYGSTPCKAPYTCRSCLEPFEYFKCL